MQILTVDAARAKIGEDLGVSEWKLIDQPLVDAFAEITGDRQFIHVDPDAAAATPLGGTIAHGFLTLSLLATLLPPNLVVLEGVVMGLNYGFEKVRFLQPVRVGRRVRARHILAGVEPKGPGRVLTTTTVTMEIAYGRAELALSTP